MTIKTMVGSKEEYMDNIVKCADEMVVFLKHRPAAQFEIETVFENKGYSTVCAKAAVDKLLQAGLVKHCYGCVYIKEYTLETFYTHKPDVKWFDNEEGDL